MPALQEHRLSSVRQAGFSALFAELLDPVVHMQDLVKLPIRPDAFDAKSSLP